MSYNKEYYLKNKEKMNKASRRWRQEHKEEQKLYQKLYYQKNREAELAYGRKRCQLVKEEILLQCGGGKLLCAMCGFSDIRALTIDHIDGGGNEHRKTTGMGLGFYLWLKRNNYPEGYQVLCMNCQFIKRELDKLKKGVGKDELET